MNEHGSCMFLQLPDAPFGFTILAMDIYRAKGKGMASF
jgi:hypothetical protein